MRNHTASSRSSRVVATIVATIVVVAAFASFGGVGLAHGVINLAQYQYGKKITICHKKKVTITVSVNAWPAHQRHGDTVGPCQAGAAKKSGQSGKGQGKGQGNKGQSYGNSSSSSGSQQSGTGKGNNGNGKGNGKGK